MHGVRTQYCVLTPSPTFQTYRLNRLGAPTHPLRLEVANVARGQTERDARLVALLATLTALASCRTGLKYGILDGGVVALWSPERSPFILTVTSRHNTA
jgi:hypothetical protein